MLALPGLTARSSRTREGTKSNTGEFGYEGPNSGEFSNNEGDAFREAVSMGLLAPLYALAALAIAGPIIAHLIRRQPQGQLQFSSLMFLSPSPPRLTRRSRLDNLWLLLLRGLAIALIAVAFARPYWRADQFLSNTLTGRRIVVLLDTSASMQRSDVWAAAQRELGELLDGLSPQDQVALYTIDRRVTGIVPIDDQVQLEPAATQQAARTAAAELRPTWHATALGDGLKDVADMLTAASISGKVDPTIRNEVVLISDLHSGSRLETLQGYAWPESVALDVRRILPKVPGNARVSLMPAAEDEALPAADARSYRVRVENDSDSLEQTFRLAWADSQQVLAAGATSLQVPAGQVRVVPLSGRPPRADRIRLEGDAWDADNAAYVAEPVRVRERIGYWGPEAAQLEDDPCYFLTQAPLGNELVEREVLRMAAVDWEAVLQAEETTAVVLEPTPDMAPQIAELKEFVRGGGTLVISLARPASDETWLTNWLRQMLDSDQLEVAEAEVGDFALLAKVDYQHPVFAPLADPRFNDFSKLRFWSHRSLSLPPDTDLPVLASFDDGSPLLLERSLGDGRMWVLTTGWQPTASGLALSSKFIPILMGVLDPLGAHRNRQLTYEVGETIDVTDLGEVQVAAADGRSQATIDYDATPTSLRFNTPGLYWLDGAGIRRQVAIQIPASESRLAPLDVDQFEQYGIPLGSVQSDAQRQESLRQLQVAELESKQRMWQWLITACLLVLAGETFLAGWLQRS